MVNFIEHKTSAGWGWAIHIMESNGLAFARVSQYNNEKESIILDSLSVSESMRRKGLATKLQEIRENIGIEIGAQKAFLWTLKGSWMQEWYKRRGYENYEDFQEDNNYIWMVKDLKK